ncbi:MAG: carboxypeptidase [Leptolyngbya sp.]|nr:MAG: carboxypeptidase [Leptolyngbya sp.]
MDLLLLSSISEPVKIVELTEEQLKELQIALNRLGYPVGEIDGLIGPRIKGAWAEFKTDIYQGNPELIGIGSINSLKEKLERAVYDLSTREGAIAAIKAECKRQDIGLNTQIAYVLATTQWETAQTFQPVRESYWWDNKYGFAKAEEMRSQNKVIGKYFPYYGRGYVQITWNTNYEKYSRILEIDLVNNPDLAMRPETSMFILVHGFKVGNFTGRKLADYINESRTDFYNARRCINGLDKATEIKALAEKFLNQV